MSDKCKDDMCKQIEIGRKLYHTFTTERIKTGKVNLWARMKKPNLQTCKTMSKIVKVKLNEKVIELKEDTYHCLQDWR